MPFASRAQARLFHAVEHNPEIAKSTGISRATADKFISDSHGQKLGGLPDHVPQRKAGGGRAGTRAKRFVW